jgi:hypothetical protein
MKAVVLCLMALNVLVLLSGCTSNAGAESPVMPPEIPEILHEGNYIASNIDTNKEVRVITTQSNYEAALAIYSNDSPNLVDFSSSKILLINFGRKKSNGYSIKINEITRLLHYVKVYVNYTRPGEECVVGSVISTPYKFVKIDLSSELDSFPSLSISDISIIMNESLITDNCQ